MSSWNRFHSMRTPLSCLSPSRRVTRSEEYPSQHLRCPNTSMACRFARAVLRNFAGFSSSRSPDKISLNCVALWSLCACRWSQAVANDTWASSSAGCWMILLTICSRGSGGSTHISESPRVLLAWFPYRLSLCVAAGKSCKTFSGRHRASAIPLTMASDANK